MRKAILAVLVSIMGLNLGGNLALADGMILPEHLPVECRQGAGQNRA